MEGGEAAEALVEEGESGAEGAVEEDSTAVEVSREEAADSKEDMLAEVPPPSVDPRVEEAVARNLEVEEVVQEVDQASILALARV